MNILYLSNTRFAATPFRDASTRYRCYNFAEALHDRQYVVDVGVIDIIDTQIIERYDAVIVLRPTFDRKLVSISNICKSNNIIFVADFDDLIFDPAMASHSPVVKNDQASEEHVENIFRRHKDSLQLFDKFTVATAELAERLSKVKPDAEILHLPNGLSAFSINFNNHLIKESAQTRVTQLIDSDSGLVSGDLTYLPGTRSHDHDFAHIQNTLSEIVSSNNTCRLKVIGALQVNESIFETDKLVRGTWKEFYELPNEICNSWITIAPLAESAFNQCKSHIKFIESAAFGTPHISSHLPDLNQHETKGLSVVTDESGWLSAVEQYKDPTFYEQCVNELRSYALDNCMANNSIDSLLSFINTPTHNNHNEYTATLSKTG